jgi:hypothetical protein
MHSAGATKDSPSSTRLWARRSSSVTTGTGVYPKQGLNRGVYGNGRTDVFWVGPTARGASFAAAEQAALGTDDGA